MSKSYSTRLGLTLDNDDDEIDQFIENWEKLDISLGTLFVNPGVTPSNSLLYDGAVVAERTTGKAWIAKKNGLGTYDKQWLRYPYVLRAKTASANFPSIAIGTWQEFGFSSFISSGSFNSKATDIVANEWIAPIAGIYSIDMWVQWAANQAGERVAALWINGSANTENQVNLRGSASGFEIRLNMGYQKNLAKGDRVSMAVAQNSGATLAMSNSLAIAMLDVTGIE